MSAEIRTTQPQSEALCSELLLAPICLGGLLLYRGAVRTHRRMIEAALRILEKKPPQKVTHITVE